jgi:hypothetical protein
MTTMGGCAGAWTINQRKHNAVVELVNLIFIGHMFYMPLPNMRRLPGEPIKASASNEQEQEQEQEQE